MTVPKPLTALMGALPTTNSENGDKHTFNFQQQVPIPSYLIAFAVGDLTSKDIGTRCRVWTEKSMIDAAAYELEETESYLQAAETLLPLYAWGRYDILVLPGSFPYGGMENPCLSFVTPTIIAGDRSLTSLVAHELAHSWTGNLVGCRTWEHFWLNEGCTVFLERKLVGRLFGEDQRQFRTFLGNSALIEAIKNFGSQPQFTTLVQDQKNVDPDDAFSSVPYEKGSQFLFYLEKLVGGPAVFEPFFKKYLENFSGKTLDSAEFKEFFLNYFNSLNAFEVSKLSEIDWDSWFNKPGLPPVDMLSLFDTTLAAESFALANKWKANDSSVSPDDLKSWSSHQVVHFLEQIEAASEVTAETLQKMDVTYKLSEYRNYEIRFHWYMAGIKHGYEPVYPLAVQMLREQGRMKFVRPLYRELAKTERGKALAIATFAEQKDNYHSIASKMVSRDLGV
eukprot:TRINITY_DN2774_c0_g3_i1.p1 TRINITY_DN2774_c0_g3~~TRINITY_DN2774_c0_g3_i1.p1  ORF type:complete len:450 (+),score=69.22 TRINITY_DN2774_c0_g3_i1:816-2165(+)